MTTALPIAADDVNRHPAFRAWLRARPRSPAPTRIDALKPHGDLAVAESQYRIRSHKWSVFRLHGVLPGEQAVIAKFCPRPTGDIEQLIYAELLPEIGLSAPDLLEVAVEDDETKWLFLSDEGDAEWRVDDRNQRILFTQWISSLQTLASTSSVLPRLPRRDADHYLATLRLARERLAAAPRSASYTSAQLEDLAAIDDVLVRLECHWKDVERVSRALPETLVHGDLVPKNLRVGRRAMKPSLVVLDWEMAGVGPPAADLAHDWLAESHDLRTQYRNGVRRWLPELTDAEVTSMIRLGVVFRLLASISWQSESLEWAWKTGKCVDNLRDYAGQLGAVVVSAL